MIKKILLVLTICNMSYAADVSSLDPNTFNGREDILSDTNKISSGDEIKANDINNRIQALNKKEKVFVRMRLTNDFEVPHSGQGTLKIPFNIEDHDNYDSFNPGTAEFTVPTGKSGLYVISGQYFFDTETWTLNTYAEVFIVGTSSPFGKNGFGYLNVTNSFTGFLINKYETAVYLTEGEVIQIHMKQYSSSTKTLRATGDPRLNYVHIKEQ